MAEYRVYVMKIIMTLLIILILSYPKELCIGYVFITATYFYYYVRWVCTSVIIGLYCFYS